MPAFTLFMVSFLAHEDFRTREAATSALLVACSLSAQARATLPEKATDCEVRHRLAYVRESLWLHFLSPTVRELCAGPWEFNPESPEGQGKARFVFYPDGTMEYHSGGARVYGRDQAHWFLDRDQGLHVRCGFSEDYFRQPNGTWKLPGRDLRIHRLP